MVLARHLHKELKSAQRRRPVPDDGAPDEHMNSKMNFTIAGAPAIWRTHRIMDLCDYLSATVLEPQFTREGTKWDHRFMNFFSFDNDCDPMEPTGTIRFRVPPMFAGRVGELERAVPSEFSKLKIKAGPFDYERDPRLQTVEVIIIPVTDNPTALNAPPDVNMSQTRGCLVMRDLLGYQRTNDRYEFTPEDLIRRVSTVTEEKIAACTASPVKTPGGVRRTPSAVSMKAIRRCLEEIKQFGLWALSHNHKQLAAI